MNSKRIIATLTIILSCTGFSYSAMSAESVKGDADAGKAKAILCAGCHGLSGEGLVIAGGQVSFPALAGQVPGYFIKSIYTYRNNERNDAMMRAIALGLTDADIINLAAYYASLK